MHILEQKIRNARAGGRTALIPFITAGFPSPDRFRGAVEELDAHGADIIEIGIPFSDPVADGPVVEDASRILCIDLQQLDVSRASKHTQFGVLSTVFSLGMFSSHSH